MSPTSLLASPVSLLDALPHGVAVTDERGVVVTTNRRWEEGAGDGDPVVQPRGADLLARSRTSTRPSVAVAEHICDGVGRLLDGRGHSFQVQYQVPTDDPGEPRWFLLAAERLPTGGVVVTRTETTVHHGVNDVLAEMAFHDTLTGLPNRGLLLDRVRMALIRAQRLGSRPMVVFADLDGFKAVNDLHGHEAGDAVLVETARRLTAAVREGDTCGRWGGDEFVMVMELSEPDAAARVLDRIVAAMAPPFVLPGTGPLPVGVSLGAVVGDGTERPEALVAAADHAMYRAKQAGAGPVLDTAG